MSLLTNYARLLLWAGQESAWLEAMAIGLVQAKAYVPAQACRKRAAEITALVTSFDVEGPEVEGPSPESLADRRTEVRHMHPGLLIAALGAMGKLDGEAAPEAPDGPTPTVGPTGKARSRLRRKANRTREQERRRRQLERGVIRRTDQ